MMDESKKQGFWKGLFRSRSTAQNGRLSKEQPRRASEGDVTPRRRRSQAPQVVSTRRRRRRSDVRDVKGKGKEEQGDRDDEPPPLSAWPPSGMSSEEELTLGLAMELVSRGVPAHKGLKRPVPHRSDHWYALYSTTAGNRDEETDGVNQHDAMIQLSTLRIAGFGGPTYPWETLEQPSLAFAYGARPGTITLNGWTSLSSMIPPMIEMRDSGMIPRDISLTQIFERLKELERGLEDNEDYIYKSLYKRLLRDPDKASSPHKSMEKQITDLIMALSRPDWIDFTNPRNQVVTKFIFDTDPTNHQQYLKFFQQLLLSLELDLRINSKIHNDVAKEQLLNQIPPKLQWNLALARRWRDNIRVEQYGKTANDVRLRYKLRKRQASMLKRFAQIMKWPNLNETLAALKSRDADASALDISSATMAFFSGLVLPGPTFPFLIMNTLIDIDPDGATDDLALLSHTQPSCGFQYRNSYTYWSSTCIVGKVLAPTCRELAGWIGPARPTVDLGRSQIARIHCKKARQRIRTEDVITMSERSDPLGPPAEVFPVKEYELVGPDLNDYVDTVRTELLSLKALPNHAGHGPQWFEATMQFAIDGVSWPLRLHYDVSFINAWPCSDGPHPLFFDYVYQSIRADDVVRVQDWGSSKPSSERSAQSTPVGNGGPSKPIVDDSDPEKVLVVRASETRDDEVLARAWCSHWGLSAVVADIGKTCMACAIREAYAATVTVVILVEDSAHDDL